MNKEALVDDLNISKNCVTVFGQEIEVSADNQFGFKAWLSSAPKIWGKGVTLEEAIQTCILTWNTLWSVGIPGIPELASSTEVEYLATDTLKRIQARVEEASE